MWWQSPSEHQRLEFKEAKTQFDNRKLYEYCVALANLDGAGERATQMRVRVRRILRQYGYPPDKQEQATQTVLQQAEMLSHAWAAA